MTSSTLFSRKLEHIRATRRSRCRSPTRSRSAARTDRATIQGDARVIDEDPHGGWERLLPIWEAKEPSIVYFLKARVALPLFFERALIEITPRRVLYWSDGDAATRAERRPASDGGRVMRTHTRARRRPGLDEARRPTRTRSRPGSTTPAIPVSVAVDATIDAGGVHAPRSTRRPASTVPTDRDGLADRLAHPPAARLRLRRAPARDRLGPRDRRRRRPSTVDGRTAWGWDEAEVPFFEYSERSVGAVAALLRCAVGGARDAGQAASCRSGS